MSNSKKIGSLDDFGKGKIMITFIFIFAVIASIGVTISAKVFERNKEKGSTALMSTLLISAALMLVYILAYNAVLIDGSTRVAKHEDTVIFHDSTEDSYFVIDNDSWWNPLQMYNREYLDSETVEKYIELTDQIDNLNVLGKESDE